MYLHFLKSAYNTANKVTIIKIDETHAVNCAVTFCLLATSLDSPHSGEKMGSPSNSMDGSVNAFAQVCDGLTNLYSSIMAELKMMLSIILEQNMAFWIEEPN